MQTFKKIVIYFLLWSFGILTFPVLLFLNWKNKDKSYKNYLVASGIGFGMFLIVLPFTDEPDTASTQEVAQEEEQTEEEETEDTEEEKEAEEDNEEEENEESEEKPQEQEQSEKETEDLAENTEEEIDWEEARAIDQENIDWRTDVTWDNLTRNYEDYVLEDIEIEGEVQTVQSDSDTVYIQLMMDGDVNQPVIVEAEQEYLESRIIEGDWLTAQGNVLGLTDYQTVLGKTVTAPYFYGDFVTIH